MSTARRPPAEHGLPSAQEIEAEGAEALHVPVEIVESSLAGKSRTRRIVETVVSLSFVVAAFVFAIPAISGSEYREIFEQFGQLDVGLMVLLFAFWVVVMLTYTGVLTASLPGLGVAQALVLNLAGSAVSNVVPFGGAVGVGATYAMGMSWGFQAPAITLSILVTGIWNVFAKLVIPVLALVVLVIGGHANGQLVAPAILGVVVVGLGVAALALVLRSERLALWVGSVADRAARPLGCLLNRSFEVGGAVLDFRHQSIGLLRTRWLRLTLWMLAYNAGQFLLLLGCVRALGTTTDELGWVEVLGAFAFANLLTTISITPSGVGFVEAGTVAALIAFGGPEAASAAAVLLFRGFTYLLEIPVGALGWVVWATRRSWRHPVARA